MYRDGFFFGRRVFCQRGLVLLAVLCLQQPCPLLSELRLVDDPVLSERISSFWTGPSWVHTRATSPGGVANTSWGSMLQQYHANLGFDSSSQEFCQSGNLTKGFWIAPILPSLEPLNCTLDLSHFQYAIFLVSNQSYSQADNIGAFSNPEAVEKLCGTGVFASPQDDDLQIELNEQLIYNATRANGGPADTLVATDRFKFSIELDNSTVGNASAAAWLDPYSPNYPDPKNRRVEALFNTAAIAKNASIAKPPIFKAYPQFYPLNGFASTHLIVVDLVAMPKSMTSFNIRVPKANITWDLTPLASVDSCAFCGICMANMTCPFDPDFCDFSTRASYLTSVGASWTVTIKR